MADEDQKKNLNSDQIAIKIESEAEIELEDLKKEDSKEGKNSKKFLLNLIVIKKFHSDFSSKSSRKFLIFAEKLEKELKEIFPVVKFSLRNVLKIGFARRKIFVTLACEISSSDLTVKEFERKLRNLIFVSERLKTIQVSFWDLKCKEVDEEEFEHFIKFGFDLCGSCGEIYED